MLNVIGLIIVVGVCIAFPPIGAVVLLFIGLAMMGD